MLFKAFCLLLVYVRNIFSFNNCIDSQRKHFFRDNVNMYACDPNSKIEIIKFLRRIQRLGKYLFY